MTTKKKKEKPLSPGGERLRQYLLWLYTPQDQKHVPEPKDASPITTKPASE
jgi:hypothetical protein